MKGGFVVTWLVGKLLKIAFAYAMSTMHVSIAYVMHACNAAGGGGGGGTTARVCLRVCGVNLKWNFHLKII